MTRLRDLAFSFRSRAILRDLVVSRSAVRGSRSNSDHDPLSRASSVEIIRIRGILISCNKKLHRNSHDEENEQEHHENDGEDESEDEDDHGDGGEDGNEDGDEDAYGYEGN